MDAFLKRTAERYLAMLTDLILIHEPDKFLLVFFLNRIGDMQEVILKHRLLLEALQARDADRAVSLMARHIRAFQEEVLSAMLGGTDAE